jgi:hypothetical protein
MEKSRARWAPREPCVARPTLIPQPGPLGEDKGDGPRTCLAFVAARPPRAARLRVLGHGGLALGTAGARRRLQEVVEHDAASWLLAPPHPSAGPSVSARRRNAASAAVPPPRSPARTLRP